MFNLPTFSKNKHEGPLFGLPFVTAEVLRKNPNIKWTKDRGKDPESARWYKVFGGDRINNHHLTIAEKQAARDKR
jgi:hypothetical protein